MTSFLPDLVAAFRAHHAPAEPEFVLVAELSVWAATCDGVLAADEVDQLAGLLQRLPGLEHYDTACVSAIAQHLAATYRDEDAIAARIAEIAMSIRASEARHHAFRLAIWSAARDGNFSEEEAAFLQNLQECLEIDDADADAMLEATIDGGAVVREARRYKL